MNNLDTFFSSSINIAGYAAHYSEYLQSLLKKLDVDSISKFGNALLSARDRGSSIFFCGNGGSASTASHFANDIAIGIQCSNKPFRAISLTDNNAIMTAIANDFGYDQIFTKQLETLMLPGDIVVGISASGNSSNIIAAIEMARIYGNTSVALTGFDGGKLRQIADIPVHVDTQKNEYGPVEDVHLFIDHLLGSYLMRYVKSEEK